MAHQAPELRNLLLNAACDVSVRTTLISGELFPAQEDKRINGSLQRTACSVVEASDAYS